MNTLNTTWLVQRLLKPINSTYDNPFAFGGGLKNGGLSDNAMKLLRPIFSFDYMGRAEFEFGAVPLAFKNIATNIKNYSTWELKINSTIIYIIGNFNLEDQINERIKELAANKIHCKEYVGLNDVVGLGKQTRARSFSYIGWLELDNDFLFFADKDAFEKTAVLFELMPKLVKS